MIGCLTETTTCVVAKPLVFLKVLAQSLERFRMSLLDWNFIVTLKFKTHRQTGRKP